MSNTLPMMGGDGPFGSIGMGGMFTVLKVRKHLTAESASGWYDNPPGTVSESVENWGEPRPAATESSSPSHHQHDGASDNEGEPR